MRRIIQLLVTWCWAAMLISCSKEDSISPVGPTPPTPSPTLTTPVISNLSFSPTQVTIKPDQPSFAINGTLNYKDVNGGVASVKLKTSTGLELTVPVPLNNQSAGTVTGSFQFGMVTKPGFIDFEVWIIDLKGVASNKLTGRIEMVVDDHGTMWHSYPTSVRLWRVRWLEDLFMAVGENGSIVFLGPGSLWEPIPTEVNSYLRDITWTGLYFLAVGDNSTILTSIFADEWAKPSVPINDAFLTGVAWSGSQAIVVGSDAERGYPVILRSGDCINWTRVLLPPRFRGQINGVIWAKNKFVAFGRDVIPVIYISSDGTNWTQQSFSGYEGEFTETVWNGSTFCAVGPGITAISPDGYNWTTRAVTMIPYGVTWGGNTFMMTSFTGIFKSENGLDWTKVSEVGSNPPISIAWSGVSYAAVGGMHGPAWMVSP